MAVPAVTVTMTKLGDAGVSVQIVFISNGGIRYAVAIPGADFTSFNTTVNGGVAGTSLSKTYGEDVNIGLLPVGYNVGV